MIPQKTVLHGKESVKNQKQITLERWYYKALMDWSDTRIRKMTKGILLYECLMMHNTEVLDVLDGSEETLNEKLEDEGISVEAIDSIKVRTESEAVEKLKQNVRESESDFEPEEKQKSRKLWIPPFVDEGVSWDRGWADKIEDYVVKTYCSAFHDRADRIKCKRDILSYLQDGVNPDHRVAQTIVNRNSDRYLNVQEAHRTVTEDSDSGGRELPGTITISDIFQNAHELSSWDDRFKAMEKAVEHDNPPLDVVVDAVQEGYEIDTESYAIDKVEEFEDRYDIELKSKRKQTEQKVIEKFGEFEEKYDELEEAETEEETVDIVERMGADPRIYKLDDDIINNIKRMDGVENYPDSVKQKTIVKTWIDDNTDAEVTVLDKIVPSD